MRTKTIVQQLKTITVRLVNLLKGRREALGTQEAAAYLHTTVGYIYYLVRYHALPYHKTPKSRFYFKKSEIDAWLLEKQRKDILTSLKPGDP